MITDIGGVIICIAFIAIYFVARRKMLNNGVLFASTPEYDMENVKFKHSILRRILFLATFLPYIILYILKMQILAYASYEMGQAIKNAVQQIYSVGIVMISAFVFGSKEGTSTFRARCFEEPYILTRYMIYPKLSVSAGVLTFIVYSVTGGIAGFVYSFYENNITIQNGMDFPFGIICFILELALVYFSNYTIIGWYDSTSNDFLFDKVEDEAYDAVAKRYYGIWRNRLIVANLVTGAQLILGGLVTLTNGAEHLMGIRILGLVVLVIVFSYILIQSRNFDDPVVVNGMVYPSEKKRVMTKWVIGIAIIVYILGVIILL